MLISIATFLAT